MTTEFKTLGQAIDYLMGDKNRRVSAVVNGEPRMFSFDGRGVGAITEFMYRDAPLPERFIVCRSCPPLPNGFAWKPSGTEHALGLVAKVGNEEHDPIADARERDIQAARVAEFDSRPKG